MTTQFGDKLNDDGEQFSVKPFPLNQLGGAWHGSVVDDEYQSRFSGFSTACWRRYIAK
jgi:hypothetical protein